MSANDSATLVERAAVLICGKCGKVGKRVPEGVARCWDGSCEYFLGVPWREFIKKLES